MEFAIRVQILNEPVYVSLCVDTLGKDMALSLLTVSYE